MSNPIPVPNFRGDYVPAIMGGYAKCSTGIEMTSIPFPGERKLYRFAFSGNRDNISFVYQVFQDGDDRPYPLFHTVNMPPDPSPPGTAGKFSLQSRDLLHFNIDITTTAAGGSAMVSVANRPGGGIEITIDPA